MIRSTSCKVIAAVACRGGDEQMLARTLARLDRCRHVDRIVVLHAPSAAPQVVESDKVKLFAAAGELDDAVRPARLAARRWSSTGWRGGIAGASVWDEPLAAGATVQALDAMGASAALIVGEDWPLVDPALCDAVLERHLQQPDVLKLVFTQAAPGLCGIAVGRELLAELRDKQAMIGSLLMYNPRVPQGDPIGKDPCVQIEPAVRDFHGRLIADSPRWRRLIETIDPAEAHELDAAAIVERLAPHVTDVHDQSPAQVTVELNTTRGVEGPIVPQHHAAIVRPEMTIEQARELFEQLAESPDTAVTLGGLGDPLCHPQWFDIVSAARDAGLAGLHIETDLIVSTDVLEQLVDAHIDVISVRLNADSAPIYQKLMGADQFDTVLRNIEWLLNHRRNGLPWIVPRMTKTADNVHELESFFDRWMYFCGHAVIESPSTGCGAMPDLSVLPLAPPRRYACRQLAHRMSVHSNGAIATCDQHWASAPDGDLRERWQSLRSLYDQHARGRFEAYAPCAGCSQWYRP